MRNSKWLRYGLASTVLACGALGGFLVACGDDDSGVTANDAGGGDSSNNPDTGGGGTDSGNDSGNDAGKLGPAKIILVHGTTDYGGHTDALGMVRVCYATKTATDTDFVVSPLDPLPNVLGAGSSLPHPGIPIGAGGPFPSTGIPLEGFAIRPYVISAQALADRGIIGKDALTPKCNQILKAGFTPDGGFDGGAGALVENTDYWKLTDIPEKTLKNGKTYILALTGCTSDTNPTTFAFKCGPDPANASTPYVPPGTPGIGNLKIAVLEIDDTSTVANDEMGVQVLHLSPQYQFLRTATDGGVVAPFNPVFGANFGQAITPDAGYDAAATIKVGNSEISYTGTPTVTTMAKLKGIVTNAGFFAANAEDPSVSNDGPFIPIKLNNVGFPVDAGGGAVTIQYLSENEAVPAQAEYYTNGKSYTFVLVGDPQGSGLKKIHFVAYKNQFTQ